MNHILTHKEQLNRKDLFEAFKKQLAKDFEQSNFPADFVPSLQPDYQQIHEKIERVLLASENKTESHLMQLLYRIDISEAQLKRLLSENGTQKYYSSLAELIIKRVLQKVVIKHFYRNP